MRLFGHPLERNEFFPPNIKISQNCAQINKKENNLIKMSKFNSKNKFAGGSGQANNKKFK